MYCRERHLDVRSRLRLFAQVANAVAYAHGKLVVHRDLKPANILVNAEGQVRLLDFGIAKLLDDGQARETRFTEASGRALTPDYASPEQILGEPLTIASDVYSLGVILYELLSGVRPYKLQRDSRGALEDAIVQAEPRLPAASRIDPRKNPCAVISTLSSSRRSRRSRPNATRPSTPCWTTSSAYSLAGRCWRSRTVAGIARKNSPAATSWRFAASSAILLAVLVGAGVAAWQARVAVAEQRRAEEVKEFIAGIFREASPYSGAGSTTLSAVDLLKQAEKKLETEIAGQPEVRIELLTLIGESLMALGDLDAAEPVLDRAAVEARQALDEFDAMAVSIELLQAQMHRLRGRAKEARAELDRILPALRSDPATKPLDLAVALGHRTLIAIEEGAYADAERFAAGGREPREREAGIDHEQTITSSILLALAYRYTKKFTQSRDAAKDAYQAAVARFGATPPHPRVVEAKTTYGRALADTGELAAGIALIDAAVADLRTLTGTGRCPGRHLPAEPGGLSHRSRRARARGQQRRGGTQDHQRAGGARVGGLCGHAHVPARWRAWRGATRRRRSRSSTRHAHPRTGAGRRARCTLLARTGRALAFAYLGRLDDAQRKSLPFRSVVAPKDALEPLGARVAQVRGTIARMRGDLRGGAAGATRSRR